MKIPRAIDWFTGEVLQCGELEEDTEEGDFEDDENESDDDDVRNLLLPRACP